MNWKSILKAVGAGVLTALAGVLTNGSTGAKPSTTTAAKQ